MTKETKEIKQSSNQASRKTKLKNIDFLSGCAPDSLT
jgi:hypothetical protein